MQKEEMFQRCPFSGHKFSLVVSNNEAQNLT